MNRRNTYDLKILELLVGDHGHPSDPWNHIDLRDWRDRRYLGDQKDPIQI